MNIHSADTALVVIDAQNDVLSEKGVSWTLVGESVKKSPNANCVGGKSDKIFPSAGAELYKRDLKTLEFHLLDAGHFALETNCDEIASLMREFLDKHVSKK